MGLNTQCCARQFNTIGFLEKGKKHKEIDSHTVSLFLAKPIDVSEKLRDLITKDARTPIMASNRSVTCVWGVSPAFLLAQGQSSLWKSGQSKHPTSELNARHSAGNENHVTSFGWGNLHRSLDKSLALF